MESRKILSEGLLIALATAFAYAMAYKYQSGYFSYFGMPSLYITPTTGMVIKAAVSLLSFLLMAWAALRTMWFVSPSNSTPLRRAFNRTAWMAFFVVTICLVSFNRTLALAIITVSVVFIAAFQYLLPLITQRQVSGYEQKLIAQEGVEGRVSENSLEAKLSELVDLRFLVLLFVAMTLLSFTGLLGAHTARTKQFFFIPEDQPRTVVLYMNENAVILGRYDPTTLTLTGQYVVEHLSQNQRLNLKLVHLGQINPPKESK